MNRDLRRAQAKADKKVELQKQKAKAERIVKRQTRLEKRKAVVSKADASPIERKKLPGRFSSYFTVAVAVFMVLQAILPPVSGQNQQFSLIIQLLYYLMFGYFCTLWLSRRRMEQAVNISVAVGAAITLGLIAAQFFIPTVTPELRMAFFGIPAIIVGALLGNLIFTKAP